MAVLLTKEKTSTMERNFEKIMGGGEVGTFCLFAFVFTFQSSHFFFDKIGHVVERGVHLRVFFRNFFILNLFIFFKNQWKQDILKLLSNYFETKYD